MIRRKERKIQTVSRMQRLKVIDKFNYLFNTYAIENNQAIVEEIMRHYRMFGRIDDRKDRTKFVIRLFIKYGFLHKCPLEEFEKAICKLSFPETKYARQSSLSEINLRLKKEKIIVFDVWDVLVYPAINEYQLSVMNQCGSLALQDYILDNPFVHRLWNELLDDGKMLFLYNNSSYDDRVMELIIKQCGYEGKFYKGELGDMAYVTGKTRYPKDILYRNVNQVGSRYRTYYDYNVVTNVTDRIINLLLHGDDCEKSMFYEYGVTCGGILTCGFCSWLNELADRKKIDLFLFVARDGDIMQRIYQKYYGRCESKYLIFSRFASMELMFADYPGEYIDQNIRPRMERRNCDNSITKILKECGLEFMEEYLTDPRFTGMDPLNKDNYEWFKVWLLDHQEQIALHMETSVKAAEQYYRKVCKKHRKICVVDLGWHGKSVTYLKHFMERKCAMDVQVSGAMIGACGDVLTQDCIRKDLINTYVFEDDKWRSQGSKNGERMDYQEIICTEALFSSCSDTLLRYGLGKNGETVFIYGNKNRNTRAVAEIHRGILDFSGQFAPVQIKCGLKVLPRDAYTPLSFMMKNRQFLEWIYANYQEEAGAINGFT